jgi:hypothetical protein
MALHIYIVTSYSAYKFKDDTFTLFKVNTCLFHNLQRDVEAIINIFLYQI